MNYANGGVPMMVNGTYVQPNVYGTQSVASLPNPYGSANQGFQLLNAQQVQQLQMSNPMGYQQYMQQVQQLQYSNPAMYQQYMGQLQQQRNPMQQQYGGYQQQQQFTPQQLAQLQYSNPAMYQQYMQRMNGGMGGYVPQPNYGNALSNAAIAHNPSTPMGGYHQPGTKVEATSRFTENDAAARGFLPPVESTQSQAVSSSAITGAESFNRFSESNETVSGGKQGPVTQSDYVEATPQKEVTPLPTKGKKVMRKKSIEIGYISKLPYLNDKVGVTGKTPAVTDKFDNQDDVTLIDSYTSTPDIEYDDECQGYVSLTRVISDDITLPFRFFENGIFSDARTFHKNLRTLSEKGDEFDILVVMNQLDREATALINDDCTANDYGVTMTSFVEDYEDLIAYLVTSTGKNDATIRLHFESILDAHICDAFSQTIAANRITEAAHLNMTEEEKLESPLYEGLGLMTQFYVAYADYYSDLFGFKLKDVSPVADVPVSFERPSYLTKMIEEVDKATSRDGNINHRSFLLVTKDRVVFKITRNHKEEFIISRPQGLTY